MITKTLTDADDLYMITSAAETVYGLAGNDTLTGAAGRDELYGGEGNDSLNGGLGNDHFFGGNGDDVINGGEDYDEVNYSDSKNPMTVNLTLGTAIGEGNDTLISIEYVLGSAFNDTLIGGAAFNSLEGADGNDFLKGGDGGNGLYGGVGDDMLNGGAEYDHLDGGLGNDILRGDAGDDELEDLFGTNVLDGGDGNDIASFMFAETGTGYKINLELGTATAKGTKNKLISIEDVYGSVFDDIITGSKANNFLAGDEGNDTLTGGAGNDYLWGEAGKDKLIGGAGNDTYFIEDNGKGKSDSIVEKAKQGNDTVESSISYVLGNELENLTLLGRSSNISGTGNKLDNLIIGNNGANNLDGKAGNDTLTGGAGNDLFVFDTALNTKTNIDLITDFTAGQDVINLSKKVFTTLATPSVDMSTRILMTYDEAANKTHVSYDADGAGHKPATEFVTLTGQFAFDTSYFHVV